MLGLVTIKCKLGYIDELLWVYVDEHIAVYDDEDDDTLHGGKTIIQGERKHLRSRVDVMLTEANQCPDAQRELVRC